MRLLLAVGAALFALLLVELALRILDRPRVLNPHQETRRFAITGNRVGAGPIYVNYPGCLTFTYDGNPRGYFSDLNQVYHHVNDAGFRGSNVGPKRDGVQRLVFLGDSFTFGEGVRDRDTFAEVAASSLTTPSRRVESVNLGVGGYNTTQSATVLETVGLSLDPDVVILGYVPNDAEPPLFQIDPSSGRPVRRDREAFIEAEGAPEPPPRTGVYRSRFARLFWMRRRQRRLSAQTVDYYRALYRDDSAGWVESQRALREIIILCKGHSIPCIVVMFPVLFDLSESYPFASIHAKVGSVVREAGGRFVDLRPALQGTDARTLWVHPTDQHPNERVHAVAGRLVAEALGDRL